MANLNKTVVIQLKDAGIYDIITSFDEEHIHEGCGCYTCGSYDYDIIIGYADIVSTEGVKRIDFFEYDEYNLGYYITQADLNKLLLDDIVINDLKEVCLEDFYVWIKDNLESVQYTKEKEFYESNY